MRARGCLWARGSPLPEILKCHSIQMSPSHPLEDHVVGGVAIGNLDCGKAAGGEVRGLLSSSWLMLGRVELGGAAGARNVVARSSSGFPGMPTMYSLVE